MKHPGMARHSRFKWRETGDPVFSPSIARRARATRLGSGARARGGKGGGGFTTEGRSEDHEGKGGHGPHPPSMAALSVSRTIKEVLPGGAAHIDAGRPRPRATLANDPARQGKGVIRRRPRLPRSWARRRPSHRMQRRWHSQGLAPRVVFPAHQYPTEPLRTLRYGHRWL